MALNARHGVLRQITALYLRNQYSHIYMRGDGAYYVCVTAKCEMGGRKELQEAAHGPFEGQVEARHLCRFPNL